MKLYPNLKNLRQIMAKSNPGRLPEREEVKITGNIDAEQALREFKEKARIMEEERKAPEIFL